MTTPPRRARRFAAVRAWAGADPRVRVMPHPSFTGTSHLDSLSRITLYIQEHAKSVDISKGWVVIVEDTAEHAAEDVAEHAAEDVAKDGDVNHGGEVGKRQNSEIG